MNKEFTRMQKLAGILTESYNTHSEGMHGDSKEGAMERSHKGKMGEPGLKESVRILDRQADLDQAYFNLDVDGTEMGFTYWNYDEKFDDATYEEVMDMINKQLTNVDKYGFPVDTQLTPKQKEEIAQVVLRDLQTNPGWKSNVKESKGMNPTLKMKKSEFKKKLKEAILAEKALKEDAGDMGGDNAATMAAYADMDMTEISYGSMERMDSVVSRNDLQAFLFSADKIMMTLREDGFDDEDIVEYLIGLLPTPNTLSEAKKKEEEEEDVDIDLGTDGEDIDLNLDSEEGIGDVKVDMNMDSTGDVDAGSSESKKAFSELTDAYRAAKELGDEKLIRQIANTITYFNKNIILKQG